MERADLERVLTVFEGECARVIAEGLADAATLDLLFEAVGYRPGPLERLATAGCGARYAAALECYERSFRDPRYRPHALQRRLAEAGLACVLPEPAAEPPRPASLGRIAVTADGSLATALREATRSAGLPLVDAAAEADLVVVAGQGLLEVRRLGVRNALDRLAPDAWVLACCAPWSVTEVVSTLRRTERVAGFALVGDPASTRVVEVSGGLQSAQAAIGAGLAFFEQLGRQPFLVGDGPGLVLARLLGMAANAAVVLLEEGHQAAELDRAVVEASGWPLGPLAWAEQVGLDFVYQTVRTLQADLGDDRYRPALRLRRLVQAGRRRFD